MGQPDINPMERFCVNVASLSAADKAKLMGVIRSMASYRKRPIPLRSAEPSRDRSVPGD